MTQKIIDEFSHLKPQEAFRARRRRDGVCYNCREEVEAGAVRCTAHKTMMRERQRAFYRRQKEAKQ